MFPSCLCSDILAFLPCLVQKTYKFDEELNLRSFVAIFLNVECTHFWGHFWPLNFWSGNGQALLESVVRAWMCSCSSQLQLQSPPKSWIGDLVFKSLDPSFKKGIRILKVLILSHGQIPVLLITVAEYFKFTFIWL